MAQNLIDKIEKQKYLYCDDYDGSSVISGLTEAQKIIKEWVKDK